MASYPYEIIRVVALAGFLGSFQFSQAQTPAAGTHSMSSLDGRVLYKAYCASCHGTEGRGDGPMAKSLKVAPADLTRIAARNGGTFPLNRIDRIISSEEQIPGGHGTREMPVWGPFFSRVDKDQDLGLMRIDALARYLDQMQRK